MKIKNQKKSKSKKIFLTLLIVIAVLCAGVAATYYATGSLFGWTPSKKSSDTNTVSKDSTVDDEKRAGDMIKSESIAKEEASVEPAASNGAQSNVDLTITAANQNGSLLQIRTLIDSVTASGTCTLKITKGSAVVTKTAAVQALASGSTCMGFDVPLSELSAGSWNINVLFDSTNAKGSATQSVNIQ